MMTERGGGAKSYTLDLATIKNVMAAHHKTGSLSAELPPGAITRREDCLVEITFQAGALTSCLVQGRSGWSKTGREAEAELAHLGPRRLNWTFTPKSEGASSGYGPGGGAYSSIPRRTGMQAEQIHSWPNFHKLVFGHVDGMRSVAQLADILGDLPDKVEQAVHDLQRIGALDLGITSPEERSR